MPVLGLLVINVHLLLVLFARRPVGFTKRLAILKPAPARLCQLFAADFHLDDHLASAITICTRGALDYDPLKISFAIVASCIFDVPS